MSFLPDPASTSLPRALAILPPTLIGVLLAFPPEARGESQAGAAALLALLGLLVAWRTPARSGLVVLALGLVALVPATLAAEAPGAVPEVGAVLMLGVAAGTFMAGVPRRPGSDRAIVVTLAAMGALVAAWGVFQSAYGLGALADRIGSGIAVADQAQVVVRARSGRAFAGFPTPAALGGCLALILPVTVGAALERPGARRAAWLALAGLEACGLVATRSATAAGGLVAALVLFGLSAPHRRRVAIVGVALASAALCAIAVWRGGEVLDATGPDSAWRQRAGNARIALEMITDHPWIGVGPGGYGEAYPRYRRAGDNESQHVHDVPLELCAEWGVPLGVLGSAAFLWLFLAPLARRSPAEAPWRSGAAIGLAALALQNLADFTLLLPSLLWCAALVRGWLGGAETGTACFEALGAPTSRGRRDDRCGNGRGARRAGLERPIRRAPGARAGGARARDPAGESGNSARSLESRGLAASRADRSRRSAAGSTAGGACRGARDRARTHTAGRAHAALPRPPARGRPPGRLRRCGRSLAPLPVEPGLRAPDG